MVDQDQIICTSGFSICLTEQSSNKYSGHQRYVLPYHRHGSHFGEAHFASR